MDKKRANEFQVVNTADMSSFLALTKSIESPGFFLKIAGELMPDEDIGSIQKGDNIQSNFEAAFARASSETQAKILSALREKILEDNDESRA